MGMRSWSHPIEVNMDTNAEPHKQPGGKGKRWAVASLLPGILDACELIAILCVLLMGGLMSFYHTAGETLANFVVRAAAFLVIFLAVPLGLFSLVAGIVALVLIKKEAAGKGGVWMAVPGVVLGVLRLLWGLFWWVVLLEVYHPDLLPV